MNKSSQVIKLLNCSKRILDIIKYAEQKLFEATLALHKVYLNALRSGLRR